MASMTALNHGKKCMQDLDQFTESMGWTVRNLDGDGDAELYSSHDEADLSHTAFGDVVEIPRDFVAPCIKPRTLQPSTSSPFRFYRKQATASTSSLPAKTHPIDDRSLSEQQPPLQHKSRAHKTTSKPAKPKTKAVDFVYDIDMRRKLREQVDAERTRVLQEAKAREAKLRAEKKWVFDKRDKSPPRRKQAWNPSKKGKALHPDKPKNNSSSIPCERAASAPSKRSRSSTSLSSTCHSYTSIAQQHLSKTPSDDVESSIREFERRLHIQWSLHVEH